MATTVVERRPSELTPLHGVTDRGLLAALRQSMHDHGWLGAPLVLLDGGQLATGAHRWEAAIREGLRTIPIVDARDLVADHAAASLDEYDERLAELCDGQTTPEEITAWLWAVLPAAVCADYGIDG